MTGILFLLLTMESHSASVMNSASIHVVKVQSYMPGLNWHGVFVQLKRERMEVVTSKAECLCSFPFEEAPG